MTRLDRDHETMIGRPQVHYRTTDSTNERARELAALGAPHGTIVTADEQSAGRGRQGRTWVAPPGSAILMSLVVRDFGERAMLPLAVPVAVCEACEAVAAVECRIKWPNDVWIDGRKVAGILVEGRPQEGWAVVGIGVNVSTGGDEFPEELRDVATSIAAAAGRPVDRDATLEALLRALDAELEAPAADVLEAWRERDALLGEHVRWNGGDGTAAGVSKNGALIVEIASGERTELDSGEVHLLRG
jgi:BirA family transcriptional regulator, biotin operon repressor / biotin---[acetyl-CoA-carboxylase] ligase